MGTYDFTFACEGLSGIANPWGTLRVVRFQGTEAISAPYRYEIILLDVGTPLPITEWIGKRATLRIATLSIPIHKTIHGIVVEAEEIGQLPEGRTLRLVLAPPWTRARHRRHCRIFLEKTLRQIVEAMLQSDKLVQKAGGQEISPDLGGIDFTPAQERFTWRIVDTSRLDDARVYPFVVQYNESDFDFVSRLLEGEGISYHFEHGADTALLVLTDSDSGRPHLAPLVVGAGIDGREIRGFFSGARLRPAAVTLGDYNWKQPDVNMVTKAGDKGADLFEDIYPGLYPDHSNQGAPLAQIRLGRHKTEARFARGEGWLRVLGAGTIFELEHKTSRLEGEYVVTSMDVRAEQSGVLQSNPDGAMIEPFNARFECARRGKGPAIEESNFRPALTITRPKIIGSQTAIVTAEPSTLGAEINVGGPSGTDIGCVRLKFHWDTDALRLGKESSSCWVRVNEPFAGSGSGGVWHPRVGTEVIVEFEEGNPDRPIVVGRVYNGVNRPYHGGNPVMSTFKSNASPGGKVHNEITFDDSSGAELVYTNAGKDMETDVGNERLETVAANATMKVGANDQETIGANCTVKVGINENVSVKANDTSTIAGNVTTTIGSNSLTMIGVNEVHVVGGNQTTTIGATHTEIVGASLTETIGGTLTTNVAAAETQIIGGNRNTTIAGANTQSFGAAHIKLIEANRDMDCKPQSTNVGAAAIRIVGGSISTTVNGAQTVNAGAGIVFLGPTYSATNTNEDDIDNTFITITGLSVSMGINSISQVGTSLSVKGLELTATGLSGSYTSTSVSILGFNPEVKAADLENNGIKTRAGLIICL